MSETDPITLDREQSIALLEFMLSRAADIRDDLEDLGTLTPLLPLLDVQISSGSKA